MFEFAAFGFVTLVWWTWPAIAGIVFASMWLCLYVDRLRDERTQADHGPVPCLMYMGKDLSGEIDHWCWQQEGHVGEHMNQWGVPAHDFEHEEAWEDESLPDYTEQGIDY